MTMRKETIKARQKDLGAVTKRIIQVYHILKDSGKVRSVAQFAARSGYNRIAVHRIMSGEQVPSLYFIYQVVSNLDVNADFLFTGDGKIFKYEKD